MVQFKGASLLPPTDYLPADNRVYDDGVWRHDGDEKWTQICTRPVTLADLSNENSGDEWILFLRFDDQEWNSPKAVMNYSTFLGDPALTKEDLEDSGLEIEPWNMEAFRTYVIKSVNLSGLIEQAGLGYISPDDVCRAAGQREPRAFKDRVAAAMRHFVHCNYLRFLDYDAFSYWKQGTFDPGVPAIRFKGRYLFTESGLEQATEGVPARLAAWALQENGLLVANKGALTCRLPLSHIGLPAQKFYAVDARALMAHQCR